MRAVGRKARLRAGWGVVSHDPLGKRKNRSWGGGLRNRGIDERSHKGLLQRGRKFLERSVSTPDRAGHHANVATLSTERDGGHFCISNRRPIPKHQKSSGRKSSLQNYVPSAPEVSLSHERTELEDGAVLSFLSSHWPSPRPQAL
ncbi:hypothetical protein SKAU_G00119700 [Synaphobranchus kaupii]|uniref:Uncharacterized protein n=1 Tax=Synaphobranchus kaupii TaxID=118154 RepID=A0A9Q1J1A7_SYNKA|nr:hypothetical protein SKAU_G00119700 [Synaphobranchus kaupii]